MSAKEFAISHPNPMMRRKYSEAAASLTTSPLGWDDTKIGAFIKNERMSPYDPDNLKPPRMIQARNTRFTLVLGRRLKPVEEWMYGNKSPGPLRHLFGKCMNTLSLGNRLYNLGEQSNVDGVALDGPLVYILNDFSRYDSTASACLIRAEYELYRSLGPAYSTDPMMKFLERAQINNRCRTRGGIKYSSAGRRMSGDYNTALGNTIINYLANESLCAMLRIPYDASFNGDDSVLCLRERDLEAYLATAKQHFLRLGLLAKPVVVRDLHEVDYCQGKLVKTQEGYRLVRSPARAISHCAVATKRLGGQRWYAWLRAVGECELATNKGVPVMQAMAACFMRNSWYNGRVNAIMDRDLFYRKAGERTGVLPVTHEARFWFWAAFGISPEVQRQLEAYYDRLVFVGKDYHTLVDLSIHSASMMCEDPRWAMFLRG